MTQPSFTDSPPTHTLRGTGEGPVLPLATTTLRPLPFGAITLTEGFLADLQSSNAATSIARGEAHLESEGAFANFANTAAGGYDGEYHGPAFEDSEVYKWLEAVAWERGRVGEAPKLDDALTHYTGIVAAAQEDDGYLNTYIQIGDLRTHRYESLGFDHEIFNVGALIQSAVAQYRTTGRTDLLHVAQAAADHLAETFGPDAWQTSCGHPVIEMALVELYRTTGISRYLDQALFFLDVRGRATVVDPDGNFDATYFCDRVPVRQTTTPEGHAVRAMYLAAGATDVAIETQDAALLDTMQTQWTNMVESKMYVNGSIGSVWHGEAFGEPYDLPSDTAYGETCAAIASIQWSWRLLLATGDARYADLMERQFYNAVLSGISRDGDSYFYVNALQVRSDAVADDYRRPITGRLHWFGTSCCPTNLMRTIATIHEYVASTSATGVQVHQFASARISGEVEGHPIELAMRTNYPWSGEVTIEILRAPTTPFDLDIRIPSWAHDAVLQSEGGAVTATPGEYARITRTWAAGDVVSLSLPFDPVAVPGRDVVDAESGSLAIRRGPLIFAAEHIDQPDGIVLDDVSVAGDLIVEHRDDILGGIDTVVVPAVDASGAVLGSVTTIPYFLWANRVVGPMRVWLPKA